MASSRSLEMKLGVRADILFIVHIASNQGYTNSSKLSYEMVLVDEEIKSVLQYRDTLLLYFVDLEELTVIIAIPRLPRPMLAASCADGVKL